MDIGSKFPVSDYYKPHVVDARTLSRTGNWWTAILIIKDPKNGNQFVGCYKWQKMADGWKRRSNLNFRSKDDIDLFIENLNELKQIMADPK